jgi:outer membrane protein assembly factor BamB
MRNYTILLMFMAGCAEAPFSPHATDNVVADVERALQASQLGAPKAGPRGGGHPMAYLVTSAPKHLAAFDLADGRVAWDVEADVTSRVAVGHGFVAHKQGKDSIAVRSAASGALRCRIALRADETFLGLTADQRVYYAVQTSSGTTRTSTVVGADADGCGVAWRDEATGSLGAPAARGGVVAVPYAYQNVVLLDGKTGIELARVRSKDEQITFVRAGHDGFLYGANSGVYLLDVKSATGEKAKSSFATAHIGSEQIRTFYYWDSYQPAQADYTAFDRNRLLWKAEAKGEAGVSFTDQSAYLHSYRYFFAFDTSTGMIKWAYAHPKVDVVGSDDAGPSVVFVSADGEVGALDAQSGGLVWSKKSGLKVAGATFDAEGFAPGTGGKPGSVAQTLSTIVEDPDARFTAVKVFAVDQMQRVPGKDVTAELVQVILKEGVAPAVVQKAADSLVNRHDKESAPLYREALAVRYDYLADRRPRSVDVLARVVAAVGDRSAVPLLGQHLLDPATPLPALKEIVKALIVLGGTESIKPLRDMVLAYRCDPGYLQDPVSLQLAVDGLLKLGGPEERRLVTFVAEEPRTIQPLVAYMHRSLAETAPKAKGKAKAKPGEDRPDAVDPTPKKR